MKRKKLDESKRFDVFLCHPSQNRVRAEAIYLFLNTFLNKVFDGKYKVFYSPIDLKNADRESTEWKIGINRALKQCKCMVVYFTPQGLNSRWMNYEIGAMSIRGKRPIPIVTEDVDLSKTVLNEITVNNLTNPNKENLEQLALKIIEELNNRNQGGSSQAESNRALEDEKRLIINWFNSEDCKNDIKTLYDVIHERTIYIIGSKPHGRRIRWDSNLVSEISKELLKNEFRLASSPSVKEVGFVVAKECLNDPNNYTIAGLHRFESELIAHLEVNDSQIRDSIKLFRHRYLRKINGVLVIGGKANTRAEIGVAQDEKIKIFALPCMGGIGKGVFDDQVKNKAIKNSPCISCDKNHPCKYIEELGKYIRESIYYNEHDKPVEP